MEDNVYSISFLSFIPDVDYENKTPVITGDSIEDVIKRFENRNYYTMITKNTINDAKFVYFEISKTYNNSIGNISLLLDKKKTKNLKLNSLFFVYNGGNVTVDIITSIISGIIEIKLSYDFILLYNIKNEKQNIYIYNNNNNLQEITNFNGVDNIELKDIIYQKANKNVVIRYNTEQLNNDYEFFINTWFANTNLINKLKEYLNNIKKNNKINIDNDTYYTIIFGLYNEIIREFDNKDKNHYLKKIFAINEHYNKPINKIIEYNPFDKKNDIIQTIPKMDFDIYKLTYGFSKLYKYLKDIKTDLAALYEYSDNHANDFNKYIQKLEEKVNKSIITYVKINNTAKWDNDFRFKIKNNITYIDIEYSFNNIQFYNKDSNPIEYKYESYYGNSYLFISTEKVNTNENPSYSFVFNPEVEDIIYTTPPAVVKTEENNSEGIEKKLEGIEKNSEGVPFYNNIKIKDSFKKLNILKSKKYTFGNFTRVFDKTDKNIEIVKQMQNITDLIINNDEPPPIFIVGYGSSGAGKTSNLIYYRSKNNKENEDGILPNLCIHIINEEDLGNDVIKNISLTLKTQEFYNNNQKKNKYLDNHEIFPKNNTEYKFTYDATNNQFVLKTNTNIEIQHKYRFGFNFYQFKNDDENKIDYISYTDENVNVIDPNGNDNGKTYFFKKNTPLGLVITFLVDIDRIVKATMNNPQSSRSHVLVYVDMNYDIKKKQNIINKKVNLIVGDFAGIENEFNCKDPVTINTMYNQPNKLKKDELFYMDAIIPNKDSENIDTIKGGAILDIDFNQLNQPHPKIDEKIKEYEQKYLPKTIEIIEKTFIKSKLIGDDIYESTIINKIINGKKQELITNIGSKITKIFKKDMDAITEKINKTQQSMDSITINSTLEIEFPSVINMTWPNQIAKENFVQSLSKNIINTEIRKLTGLKDFGQLDNNTVTIIQRVGPYFKNRDELYGIIKMDENSITIIRNIYLKIQKNKEKLRNNKEKLQKNNNQFERLELINYNSTKINNVNKVYYINFKNLDYSNTADYYLKLNVSAKSLVSGISELGRELYSEIQIYVFLHDTEIEFLGKYNDTVTKYNNYLSSINENLEKLNEDRIPLINKKAEYSKQIEEYKTELKYFVNSKIEDITNKDKYENNDNDDIKEYIIINKTEGINEYIQYKILKRNILNKACTNRLYEGYFINQSLKDLREAIQIIIQSKGFNVFYNYIDSCYSQYSPDDLIYDETGIEKKIMNNIFIKAICNHITGKNNDTLTIDDVKPIVEKMVICIYCVFNIAYSTNNPPKPTYYNINFLNEMLRKKDITEEILSKEEQNFKNLEYVCKTYVEFNIDIILENSIKENLNISINQLNEVVKFIYSNFNLINQRSKRDNYLKLIDQVRTTINIINSTSSMGSLEFIDQIAKLNTTSVVCTPDPERETIPITKLFSVKK